MKLAHVSDLHLVDLAGAVPFRLLNKRITGYVNLRLVRGHRHLLPIGLRVARELRRHQPDHVVITGDLTNLALEREFDAAVRFVQEELPGSPDDISIVPGNHDAYTRGAYRAERFAAKLGPYLSSDIPPDAKRRRSHFPFVRLRGPVAIVGLETAVPRPPLVASGELGAAQRAALRAALLHPEVRARLPVLVQHHPVHEAAAHTKSWLEGLRDGAEERHLLESLTGGLLLHGHLHRRIVQRLAVQGGELPAVGATSATLDHPDPARRAGFNLYDIDSLGGLRAMRAWRVSSELDRFEEAEIPDRGLADAAGRSAVGW